MITLGSLGYAQNTQRAATPTDKIEQVNKIGDPKADIAALLAKYDLKDINEIMNMDEDKLVPMWKDFVKLILTNRISTYHSDKQVVDLQKEL